MTQGNPRY